MLQYHSKQTNVRGERWKPVRGVGSQDAVDAAWVREAEPRRGGESGSPRSTIGLPR
jgi:hypothetical protein